MNKRGNVMEDIIKQIVQIDSVALNTKKLTEESLKLKREQYEKEISDYRDEVITRAYKRADEVYEQIVSTGTQQHDLEEQKCKKIALVVENRYLQIEETLLQNTFNELFGVEG